MQTFTSSADFAKAIDTNLSPAVHAQDIRAALVSGVQQGEEQHRAQARAADGTLNLRIADWVLRGQDIPVIELIGIVGAAATAAAAASGVLAAGALIAAASSFATLCWNTWRKGAPLTKPEIAVLGFIKVNGAISEDDLQKKMAGTLDLTSAQISAAILTLQKAQLRDGSVVALIRKDEAGQWRAEQS